MPGKRPSKKAPPAKPPARPSALLDTRIIYCDDCLDQRGMLPDGWGDLFYIDHSYE